MRRLLLLRHAKSSWELAGELDYERGLTDRGRADCALIADYFEREQITPDRVICSGARRARETLEGVALGLPTDTVVKYEDQLYQSTVDRSYAVLQDISDDLETVLIVGHNPSIHDLAVDLADGGDELETLAVKFPTSALALFAFAGSWSELGPDSAELTGFVTAKQLRV
jgi:phosphohistidine phosphatase